MSVLTPIGILVFSMLIMASLQFLPGTFALFYHSLAGKFARYRTSHMALFFILGVETALTLIFLISYFCINTTFKIVEYVDTDLLCWIMAGIFISLATLFYFLYFRAGTGTKLFLSRTFVKKHLASISSIKTRSNAFMLGATSIIPEFIFSLPLFIVSSIAIMALGGTTITRALLLMLFVIIAIFPLLITYIRFNRNYNLADFMRTRFKNKTFFRYLITFSYFAIAILIILGVLL